MNGIHFPFRPDDDDVIYTAEGWRSYVDQEPPEKPELLSPEEYQGLSSAEQGQYDERRRLYTMRFGVLTTPDLKLAHDRIWAQLQSNLYLPAHAVKVGALLDGYAGLGKTTIAKTFARRFEKYLVKIATFDTPADRDLFIPVVHVTLKGLTTAKGLAEAICKYLGITLRGRASEQQLVEAICEAVRRHNILLFVIDDIHFLDHRMKQNSNIANHLKALMSLTGATFLYVGIDCEKLGIFRDPGNNNPLASQAASRFLHQVVRPYKQAGVGWRKLIVTLESHLVLLNHEAGTLERLDSYLFHRTKGNIGSLMNLVQKAAFGVIGKEERLDKAILMATQLDYKASLDDLPEVDPQADDPREPRPTTLKGSKDEPENPAMPVVA